MSRISVPVPKHTTERPFLVQNQWSGSRKSSPWAQHLEGLTLWLPLCKPPPEHFLRPVCGQSEAPPDVSVPRGDGRRRDSPALGNLSGLV